MFHGKRLLYIHYQRHPSWSDATAISKSSRKDIEPLMDRTRLDQAGQDCIRLTGLDEKDWNGLD